MGGAHNRIIAAAAKAKLGPLGFQRQGRSRLWLLDHGTWLNIVGFVPSQWSVSVDLDNATHWLWGGTGFMSWDYSVRGSCAQFDSEEQFKGALGTIASEAAERALEIEREFSSFEKIAAYVIGLAQDNDRMRPSWFGYRAGIASGIMTDFVKAEIYLRGITDERVVPHAERFLSVIGDHARFRAKVNETVVQQRAVLKLPPLQLDPF